VKPGDTAGDAMTLRPPGDDRIVEQRMRGLGLWGAGLGRPEAVVRHLTAMQAQEHAYARWSIGQRSSDAATGADVDAAFDDGRFLRTHVLRPTWHYVAREDLRWLIAVSGPRVDAGNRRRYEELGLNARTRARSTDLIAAAVAGTSLTRVEIAEVLEAAGVSTEGQRIAYLVMHAELHAAICSGPMRGRQHTYASFADRVPPAQGPQDDEALAELALRYFTTRGPATVRDFRWWAGLHAADAKRGLAAAAPPLVSCVIGGRTYWAPDEDGGGNRLRRVDLVQCYDEAIISYSESRDVLATPTASFPVPRSLDGFTHVILLDGRLLGHWRVRRTSAVTAVETRLAQRTSDIESAALDDAIDRYLRFTGAIA
jgi:hypothetical protein